MTSDRWLRLTLHLANDIPDQVSAAGGTLGIYNMFAGGTAHFSDNDRLLGGVYYGHLDGPFTNPDDFRKVAGTLRFSHGTDADGYSATAMYYHGEGNMTTDQPLRAIQEGLITRWGSLDPTDGMLSERFSLSGHLRSHRRCLEFELQCLFHPQQNDSVERFHP